MEATPLPALTDHLLQEARTDSARRAARTVCGGSDHTLRQTVIALVAGADMSEHENPGEATLQVLVGRVRVHWRAGSGELEAGDHAELPQERHSVMALQDSVILLTAANL
ncbi:MAG: LuxR family transcriptional regulator [Ornithinibacter sp.]|jgi:quercetin dioxygenase-like cupin family protein|nr:LuxR family transcriptional regulator [Ornithinibacter sp.]